MEAEHDLAPRGLALADEPGALVERDGAAVALARAGPHRVRAVGAEVLGDQIDRSRAIAMALEPLIDQELPQEMRDVGRVADLIAQHDEADQRLAVVQTELDRAAVWLLLSLQERVRDGVDELELRGRNSERLERGSVLRRRWSQLDPSLTVHTRIVRARAARVSSTNGRSPQGCPDESASFAVNIGQVQLVAEVRLSTCRPWPRTRG